MWVCQSVLAQWMDTSPQRHPQRNAAPQGVNCAGPNISFHVLTPLSVLTVDIVHESCQQQGSSYNAWCETRVFAASSSCNQRGKLGRDDDTLGSSQVVADVFCVRVRIG